MQPLDDLIKRGWGGTYAQIMSEQAKKDADALLLSSHLDDAGNAACVAARYPNKYLHCSALGWLRYHDGFWDSQDAEKFLNLDIEETLQARRKAAVESQENRNAKIAGLQVNTAKVKSISSRLADLLMARVEEFDTHPDLLNCANGIVDLRTGKFATPEDAAGVKFTYKCPTAYNPNADMRHWWSWLKESVGDEYADWLQLIMGYGLTGHTREERLLYLYGETRSGKGTFTETFQTALGIGLTWEVPFSTFGDSEGDIQNFRLAPLRGKLLVFASESKESDTLNGADLKRATGGNLITAAEKHKPIFVYKPRFLIIFSSNLPPKAAPDDMAMWGRIWMVEFPHSHLNHEDKTLKERMKSKEGMEAALAWAVAGAVRWYALEGGIKEIPLSANIKEKHRQQQDGIGLWAEECVRFDPSITTPSRSLYESYVSWCRMEGFSEVKAKRFTQTLARMGTVTPDRTTVAGKPARALRGIGLI